MEIIRPDIIPARHDLTDELWQQVRKPIQHYCVFTVSEDSLATSAVIYGPFATAAEAQLFGTSFGEEGHWFHAQGVVTPPR